MLSPPDQSDLEWHFGPGQTLALRGASKSTFGAQLEHASQRYKQSDGTTVKTARMIETTVEVTDAQGTPHKQKQILSWPFVYVKKEAAPTKEEPHARLKNERGGADDEQDDHDVELDRIERGGRITRRLQQLTAQQRTVLEAVYGGSGLYWSTRTQGRRWALLPFTRSGGKRLGASKEANPARWLLEVAMVLERPSWMDAALDQARLLQLDAEAAYTATAPKKPTEEPAAS